MTIDERRVAVLGAGTIGEALIAGLLSGGWRKPSEIVATGRREERIEDLREKLDVEATLSNADAVAGAALVVIAVKPQDFDDLLGEIAPVVTAKQTVLSIAAAIPTTAIEERLA
jgi:pyrroline-5-carboxylate reductase